MAKEEMLQQSIDFEDSHHMDTEWEEWDQFVQDGYEYFADLDTDGARKHWDQAWVIFQSVMNQQTEKISIYQLMEEQDYRYAIDEWLQDYEMELGNAENQEERLAFCQKVLELFDWEDDENEACFQCGIGDALFRLGKKEEAIQFYETWLKEEPRNVNGINGLSWLLFENGEPERAYEVVKKVIWGVACNMDNSVLFMRAKQLAENVGKHKESTWYQAQLDKFEESVHHWEMEEDDMFDEFTAPKQIPVVKMEKIYPNDPCPCGSGKKYKKCCGKN